MYKSFVTVISNSFNSDEFSHLKYFLNEKGFLIECELSNIEWNAPVEYIKEMGDNLETRIFIFKQLLGEENIILLKEYSENLEKKFSVDGKRTFNINPGFISEEGMFLLSHKSNELRGRVPFGKYYIEKQYNSDGARLIPNKNTFSEYLGERVNLFNSI